MTDITPAEHKTSGCDGKQKLSHKVAQEIIARDKRAGRSRSDYHCQFCRKWHVGSSTKSTRHIGWVK